MRVLLPLSVLVLIGGLVAACGDPSKPAATEIADADADRGRALIGRYGCGACHAIPGVSGANSMVGPPLSAYAEQIYIAGVVPNTPGRLIRFIVDPAAVDPRTAMPDLAVSESEARDIAAFLYGGAK